MTHPATAPLSYLALFDAVTDGGAGLRAVVIPQIQRDYAQGRRDPVATRIRQDFLDSVCGAAAGRTGPVSLDFVYGSVRDGVLSPLDGQQRLTALFLLHWVAAVRVGELTQESAWADFGYATRDSARMFTHRIVRHGADLEWGGGPGLRQWIEDQPWHLHAWRHDATVQSMLVVLEEIETRLLGLPAADVWRRLARRDSPAVSFRLLQIGREGDAAHELGDLQGDELYIKMNSRGKPLTEFENVKAVLQRMLEPSGRAGEFADKSDGAWSDLLWVYRGDDELIDDEFVRLLEFVHDICRWRDAVSGYPTGRETGAVGTRLDDRLRQVLVGSPDAERHREYLFHVFDTWSDEDPGSFFRRMFTTSDDVDDRVRLFVTDGDEDLFHTVCRRYRSWETRARGDRAVSIADTLMLHAVLVHRGERTGSFPDRIRVLRNLLGQRENRAEEFPQLLREVEEFVRSGDLSEATMLGWDADRQDELAKRRLLRECPHIEPTVVRLENHPLLRGSLTAFDLDPSTLPRRAEAFIQCFDPDAVEEFHGALLAVGFETMDQWRRGSRRRGGTSAQGRAAVWRELFQYASRDDTANLREAMGEVLDEIDAADGHDIGKRLMSVAEARWERAVADGRLRLHDYLARYPAMRRGESGLFELEDGSEYQVCALRRTQLNSNYRDAYLSAALASIPDWPFPEGEPWFTGYASGPRWLEIPGTGRIRVRDAGIQIDLDEPSRLRPESVVELQRPLTRRGENPAPDEGALGVPVPFQVLPGGRVVDSVDRVALIVDVISRLSAMAGD